MPSPHQVRLLSLLACFLGLAMQCGCHGPRQARLPSDNFGDFSPAEKQKQADSKARQLGQKPFPVDFSRN